MSVQKKGIQQRNQISRREFLINAGWLAGGTFLGSLAFLNACNGTGETNSNYSSSNAPVSKTVITVDTPTPANSTAETSNITITNDVTTDTTELAETSAPANSESATNGSTTITVSESLEEILKKSDIVPALKYDQIITANGSSVKQKIYEQKNKMRTETIKDWAALIVLVNFGTWRLYNWWPEEKMAMRGQMTEAGIPASVQARDSLNYSPTVLGAETMDGKDCLRVQYAVNEAIITQWIWKEYGLPVRLETATLNGDTIVEYQNYDFSDIPDSMFELQDKCSLCKYGDLCD